MRAVTILDGVTKHVVRQLSVQGHDTNIGVKSTQYGCNAIGGRWRQQDNSVVFRANFNKVIAEPASSSRQFAVRNAERFGDAKIDDSSSVTATCQRGHKL